jgi:hypothetical protein
VETKPQERRANLPREFVEESPRQVFCGDGNGLRKHMESTEGNREEGITGLM